VLVAQDAVEQACGPDRGPWLCRWVGNLTDSTGAADVAEILSPWVSVLLIVLAAVIANRLLRRLVRRAVTRWEHNVSRAAGGRRVRLIPEASAPTPTARRHERAQTIARGLASFTSIVVWIVAIALILSVFGISGSAVLTSAGLIGVALAFGAQNLLRDLINGAFMIMEDQVGVGDVVDLGVASGTVEDVSLRTTRLRDVCRTVRSRAWGTRRNSGRARCSTSPWRTARTSTGPSASSATSRRGSPRSPAGPTGSSRHPRCGASRRSPSTR
jgi:small conductance mechanosensitive channel